MCFFINNALSRDVQVISQNLTPDPKYFLIKCWPLRKLYHVITRYDNIHPDGLFIISIKPILGIFYDKYHQHVSCPTRGTITLDRCYTLYKEAYCSLPRQHLGLSAHTSVLLFPFYKQKLKREEFVVCTVQSWTWKMVKSLHDWEMFRDFIL